MTRQTLPLRVSDHAVLRYLERVGGFEIETLRQQIAARVAKNAVRGAFSIKIDGNQYLLKESSGVLVVVTVLQAGTRGVDWPGSGE